MLLAISAKKSFHEKVIRVGNTDIEQTITWALKEKKKLCPFAEVCTLRLDFESFNLLAGSTTIEGDPGFGCQDEFNVNGLGTAQRIPIICGSNNGQHSKNEYVEIYFRHFQLWWEGSFINAYSNPNLDIPF